MISIVISTRKDEASLKTLSDNINKTIGVTYEIIYIRNEGQYSLCEAYNIGIKKSQYNYFCFLHDDILFKSVDWGKRLSDLMEKDKSIGLIGAAGTKFKSTYPSGWGQSPYLSKFNRGHIFSKLTGQSENYFNFDNNFPQNEIDDVVCVDGVLLFTKKEVLQVCKFDETMLTNFHGYDIDFSLQVYFNSYRVLVDRNLLLTHHSGGNYSKQYTLANRLIVKKWRSKLPVATNDTNLRFLDIKVLDLKNWFHFLFAALKRKIHILK
ncbi:MAG: glycosyltransferase [Paludibacter sp.]